MAIPVPPIIDLSELPDEDAPQLIAAPSPPAPPLPEGTIDLARLPEGAIDITQLPSGPARAVGPAYTPEISKLESFGRGSLTGGTFGFEQEIGLADQAAQDAAKKANPWTYFMGEMAGSLVPMVGAGGLGAAAKGTSLAAKAARGAASVMAPKPAATLGANTLQGLKVGAVYSGLSGAGHADVKPEDSWLDSASKRAVGAITGTAIGAPLGAVLGAGGHGLSRLAGSVANRVVPELREVGDALRSPETQGARDIGRYARYDKYTPEDFAALREAVNDPAQAHRYEGLNLLEALEVAPMRPLPHTGELKPEIKVSPNLSDLAQDTANTQGAGRQVAREAWATRNQEMGAKIAGEVDQTFADPVGAAIANQFGRTIPSKADDIARLPQIIDEAFGSASSDVEANAATLAGRTEKFNKAYQRLKDGPLQLIGPELTRVAQTVPEVQQAINYAAKRDMIRLAEVGADWSKAWSAQEIGQGLQTLSPRNMLDMHHFFVMKAKPTVGGDPAEQATMQGLKNWFSKFVDDRLAKHKALRSQYTAFKAAMEGQELAETLSLVGGGLNPKALQFFANAESKLMAAARAAERYSQAVERTDQRIARGEIKTPNARALANYNRANELAQGWQEVIDNFRAVWGEKLKQQIASTDKPDRIVEQALTQAGRERLLRVLGAERGEAFLNNLLTIEARTRGLGLGLKAGGSDHAALQFFDKAVREGRDDVVTAFRQAWGDKIKQELAAASTPAQVAQIVRSLLTKEGKDRINRILGPEDGRVFIESLYNKEQQLGLGQRLYGGPDTAYKLARNQKMDALMDVVHGLTPWAPRPSQVWSGLRQLGSAAYKQRRADQINNFLAPQGNDAITSAIDAILAAERLRQTAHPYVLNPALRATGPAAATVPGQLEQARQPRPAMPPYRRP